MLKCRKSRLSALLKVAGCAAIAVTAAGCEGIHGEVDDVYTPQLHYQRFPIEVSKGKVQMKVPARSARLSSSHEDAIARFGQSARDHEANTVSVARPAGSNSADMVAGRITQLLAAQGIGSNNIRHTTYSGHGPVILSYGRYMARTAECGDWSQDVSRTAENEPYPDYGCSHQHNIAAMVANPKDFVQPRTSDPANATRRGKVLADYSEGKNTATKLDAKQDISIADAVK
jgi:pilus assembly protein CpaD